MLVTGVKKCLFFLFVVFSAINLVEPVRHDLSEMMFASVPGAACFRRMNGTHQFGCSSPQRGALGVIHVLYDTTTVETFVKDAVAGPYVVVVPPLLFTKSVMDKLIASDKVSGAVLAWPSNSPIPENYSPDDSCPNRNEGFCDNSNPWNLDGNGFLVKDWPFPVFLVQEEAYLENITQCFKDFNLPVDSTQLDRPLCSLQLKSHMFGAVSSEVCVRRIVQQMMVSFKYCDPMGSENIIYPMINVEETSEKKLIAVITRLDGASIFDGLAPAGMSAVSGTATLIVLANILNDLRTVVKSHKMYKGVIFMLLNGESFDYIGSQRVVYDMEQGTFLSASNKISLNDIGMVIELSQLGPGKTFYLHKTDDSAANEFSDYLIEQSKNSSVNFQMSSLASNKLPPVSVNTFLKANKNISAIVITNYDDKFTNRYYNGMLDNATNMNFVPAVDFPAKDSTSSNLANVAAVLAKGLVNGVNKDQSIAYDIVAFRYAKTMDDILSCYLVSRKCGLFEKIYPAIGANARGPEVLPLYVGIPVSVSHITRATSKLLSYLSAPSEDLSYENCTLVCNKQEDLQCFWIKVNGTEGKCLLSPVHLTSAVSPAFEIENYDWSSGQYSTWTESVWSETSVRMFVKGNRGKDIVVFVIGLVCFFMSLVSVFFINKKSSILFSPKLQPENC